ncbi:hypothetical protein E3226_007125 [Legionella geestiana]|uniref:plasmid fertility inhibition factor family protein n=1 Tax=Legionella geestiana TaxID=45065 RepID=UPI001093166F|nr:hypothetical protein [Legionella geestiana]QDQ40187.1 hypothetical protein E3226_007125 [Legionella geestiana]
MNQIEIIINKNVYGQETIIYKIQINNGFAYMQVSKSIFDNGSFLSDEHSDKTIIIDGNRFLKLWQNDPGQSERLLAFGNESVWRNDYKFHYAENGFSQGEYNPVPLAYIHCYNCNDPDVDTKPYCTFTNGITRTIWLLANGATCFPVMTDNKSYELLKLYAGIHEQEKLIQNMI